MRFSEARGRKVVSTSSAETVGKVSGFLVESSAARLVGLTLKKTKVSGDVLAWESIAAFGADAITVPGESAVTEGSGRLAELADKRFKVLGKRVLTTAGDELGKVDDVEFTPEDGEIRFLLVGGTDVDAGRLVATGSYAVVVTDNEK